MYAYVNGKHNNLSHQDIKFNSLADVCHVDLSSGLSVELLC